MVDTKSRTPPSSACKIYGKVPPKIFNTLFRKSTGRRKQNNEIFVKRWGKLTWQEGHVNVSHFGKRRNPNCSFYHVQAKELDSKYAANVCTVIAPGMDYIWRHGAADIQIPDLLGSKRKMDN